ncbi:MAG: ATP-binding cassette domain-containing protein [Planctomycetes bacterium]|nr:ATP-binding cassette domain-containing protein [Planctomycetota bacterium]
MTGNEKQNDVVLKVTGLSYAYSETPILEEVSFEVYRGEVFFIVGESASGKTTLLRLCAGLIEPKSGTVEIKAKQEAGEDIHVSSGFVFQQHGLISSMNVYDNVALPLRYHTDLTEGEIRERVERALRSTGALEARRTRPDYLSLGLQRRVSVARAVVLHPDIIFYDDPLLGLDHENASAVAQLIRTSREDHGVTSVVVSHSLALASSLGDRIAVVVKGRIRDIGSLAKLRKSPDAEIRRFMQSHASLWLQAT